MVPFLSIILNRVILFFNCYVFSVPLIGVMTIHPAAIHSYKPNINLESAADKSGRLSVGDQIIQVDDHCFEQLTDNQALELLRKLSRLERSNKFYFTAKFIY